MIVIEIPVHPKLLRVSLKIRNRCAKLARKEAKSKGQEAALFRTCNRASTMTFDELKKAGLIKKPTKK